MTNKVVICGINTSNLPRLKNEEINDLLLKTKNNNEVARENLIIANFRLVLSIIKRFKIKGVNLDDMFQAGVVGLIKAIDNFDLSVGVKFSTYAVPMVIGEIKRYLRGNNSLRVPRSVRDTAYLVLKTRAELEKGEKIVSMQEIADKLNIAVSEVAYSLDAISDTVSIYDPVYNNNGDELLLLDQIGDEKNTEENWTEKVALISALKKLDEREKKIVYLRYFLGKTQTEISEEVGISQAQVSRLEKTALLSVKNGLKY